MTNNKASQRAIEHDKLHAKRIYIKLNKENDKDILDHLENVPNKQGYIKRLIRKDMEDMKEKMNKKYDLNLIKVGIASSCDYFRDTSLQELVDKKIIAEDTAIKILTENDLHERRVDAFGDTVYNKVFY